MMIRLLYIECGVSVQKDWANGIPAHVWYDGRDFWAEQTEAAPVPRKGETRWVSGMEGYAAVEQMPVPQMRGYRGVQDGAEIWCP